MKTEDFDVLIELICGNGCIEVHKTIKQLEKKESFSNLAHLSNNERQSVLRELKSIMDVYDGQTCSL
ncbi:MAG: hypothetical protein KAG20_09475 [Cocleimonas sp.]|nr:hypothetical protein [Cocleimonas sp.]